jgi:hypothetical protein
MASWKKVIVSGSDAILNQVTVGTSQVITSTNQLSTTKVTGSFTGSFFGDGTGITGITATGLNIPGTVTVITNEPFVVSGSAALQKITLSDVLTQITGSTDGGLTKSGSNALRLDTGSNHFTNGVRSKLSAVSYLAYNSTTGVFTFDSGSYGTFAAGAGLSSTNGVISAVAGQGISVTAPTNDAVNIDTGSIHFVTGSRKAVFETGRFVDSANIDFTVTSGVSVTGVIISGSIQVGHLNVSSSTIGATTVTLGQTTTSLIGLTNFISANISGSNITASGLLHGTNISAGSNITAASGYITAGTPAGAPNTSGAVQGTLGFFTSATLGSANVTNDMTVGGNLTVNGTTTFINTTNTYLKDQFLTLASGSTNLVDSGLLIASSSANVGNALYLEATSTGNFGRWAVAFNVSGSATSATPDSYVVTVSSSAAIPTGTPTWGNTNGFGNMHINSSDESIWIYS